ncbi:MAG: TatD family hydrolase [Proteobacteria bacterium]|nr:TatD family hydrolase [Pseudomonadota bacterium]
MIDTHAHLNDACFDHDLGDVVDRARAAGVTQCIVVGEGPKDAAKILSIAEAHAGWAYPALGLFPAPFDDDDVLAFEALAQHPQWIAFGEVGLDTWIVKEPSARARHEEVFRHIVRLAARRNLPLNIHSRNCGKRVIEILTEETAAKVHLHAFDAKPSTIALGIEAGFYFSIPTSIVHSPQKQKLAKLVPLTQMLLESDAPVLGPDRMSRNEPKNLPLTLAAIARIRDIPDAALEEILDTNTRQLYALPRLQHTPNGDP